jgi:mono/diheme cytochrome c family protein
MPNKLALPVALLLSAVLVVVSLVVAQDTSEEELLAVASHMHQHLDHVVAMKASVIEGDLQGVYGPARWLAMHDEPAWFPAAWAPYEDEVRRLAREAAAAQDLESAARAISQIGRACGDCHVAAGRQISFGYANPPPSDQQTTVTQMQRHLWAADRMWAALIGPSDAAWDRGAAMLSEVNLTASQLTSDPNQRPRVEELIGEARTVGARGAGVSTADGRTALYGEFLSLCANCHSLTGGGPRS